MIKFVGAVGSLARVRALALWEPTKDSEGVGYVVKTVVDPGHKILDLGGVTLGGAQVADARGCR